MKREDQKLFVLFGVMWTLIDAPRADLFAGILQAVCDPGPIIMTSVALIRAAAACPFFRPRSRQASLVMIAVMV